MKGDRMAKRSSFGSIMRKKLSDITNLQSQGSPSQDEKQPEISQPDKDYIDKLLKGVSVVNFLNQERMTLVKLIAERNKIIELSGAELQKMRVTLQKLQLQNWNLAQSNSQMLAELNLGKDKLKELRHELGCKNALLKAKNMELEGKTESKHKNTGSQEGEVAAEQSLHVTNDNDKTCKRNRRRTARSQSMGPSTSHQKVVDKEKVENKRRCLRRQSARFKSHERDPTENLFEIEDAKLLVSQSHENSIQEEPVPLNSSFKNEEEGKNCVPRNEAQVSLRSSIGRPLRKAAEKVQSYKEAPLKSKMRREE
ncbi:SHUGOSHIN 2-like isoform X1 [Quercus lobata]|uniref:SHUGOSHIN 2-like isoform X1 n=1 Tax=Quercus lobata TaxID=97700 RepID=UPI001246784F|nr:SHUGOSHIN 2-like isoform X1 [Quercus lobata]